jgi:predicted acylesterase/phospholipase RssA
MECDINDVMDTEINHILNKNNKKVKDTLVLSGGSVKGISQIGALHCLKKNNMLNCIKTIAGTSAGSMVGLLYCAGYQPMELFKFMKLINLNHAKKLDPYNIISKYGLDDGSRIMLILQKLINAKGFDINITFKEFYKKTNFNFIVTGSCINDKKIYYFSHTNYPDMKVLDGVRISISVPILFTPVVYEGKIFVDGGCIDNFPIHLFDKKIDNVIGIYVTEHRKHVSEIKFIEDYLNNTIQCLFEGVTHRDTLAYHKHIIKIKCMMTEVSGKESNLDIVNLFDEGFNAAWDKIKSGDLS